MQRLVGLRVFQLHKRSSEFTLRNSTSQITPPNGDSLYTHAVYTLEATVTQAVPAKVSRSNGNNDHSPVKTKAVKDSLRQVQDGHDLIFQLLWKAKNVRVVLGEPSYAHQPVQRPASLVAVYRAQLCPPDRQVPAATKRRKT